MTKINKENSEILENFIQAMDIERGLESNTVNQYRDQLTKFLSFFNDKKLSEITTGDIRAFLAFHKQNKIWNKPATFLIYITMIKAFFKCLVTDGIIDDSPAKVIRAPRPHYGEREIKYLDKDEIRKITKIMETSRYSHKDRAMFHLLLSTGMRVNEMLSLTKKNSYINIEERKIFLAKTKTRRPHYIMFSKEAQYYLKLYLIEDQVNNSEFLFHDKKGKRILRGYIWNMINDTINLAFPYGWDKPRGPHLLRHTFATDWVSTGGNLIGLQSIMGWHSLKMTEVYVHQSEDLVTQAYLEYEKKKKKDYRRFAKRKEEKRKYFKKNKGAKK